MSLFGRTRSMKTLTRKDCPQVEALETRLVPYALSGNAWPRPDLITIGFVPDGSVVGSNAAGPIVSNLQGSFNILYGSAAAWQNEFLRAAQTWAQQTNINFKVVADNGAQIGTGLYQQGDPNMADVRIGGYDFGTSTLAQAYMPAPVNNTSFAGDIQLNTGQDYGPTGAYDLYTVALHELGHALGLYHSGTVTASMYGSYSGVKATLDADDIAGVRAVTGYNAGDFSSPGYQGARLNDAPDQVSNGSFAAATDLTSQINTTSKTALVQNLNITTTADVDYYKFTVPAGLGGTVTAKMQSSGLSLLSPKITLYSYNSSTNTYTSLGTASSTAYGATVTRTATLTAGVTYWIKAEGATTATAFGTGAYALALGLAGVAAPTAASPNTLTPNGLNASAGGGQAVVLDLETQANTYAAGAQDTFVSSAMKAVGIDGSGNYVVVWTSDGQDGSGDGVYAQRFSATGQKVGGEFRVNTTTAGDQYGATVAMDPLGNFVVTWTSYGQDGSGKGVYLQRYNASGVPQGSETRVPTTTASDQSGASVALDGSGNFVVTWMSWDTSGTAGNIYGQRFSATGAKLGGEFLVNTATANSQEHAQVARNASGSFVVVWESELQDGSGFGIYGQRFDAAGVKVGSEFRVNTTTANNQYEPAAAMDSAGNFVVTWTSYAQDGAGYGVYAQRYDAAGAKAGGEFRVNTVTADHQTWSTVAMDGNGNFLVTWTSWDLDGTRYNVHGQQYSAGGALIGTQFRVNTTGAGDQRYSSSAMNVNGQAVISWFGQGGGDADGVYFQRYRINGGSGLSNLEAGVPHGYGPDGCTDHDHGDHGHDHDQEGHGDGCACGDCATAATRSTLDRNTGYAVLPSATADADLDGLRRLLASGLPQASGLRQASDLRQASGLRQQAGLASGHVTQTARRAQRDLLAPADSHDFSNRPI